HLAVVFVQRLHAGQAGSAGGELEVDHGMRGRVSIREYVLHGVEAGGVAHHVAAALERAGQRPRERGVILDDQQSAGVVGHSSSCSSDSAGSGRVTVTAAPPPGSLYAVMVPPSVRATFTARNRPRPRPGAPLLDW